MPKKKIRNDVRITTDHVCANESSSGRREEKKNKKKEKKKRRVDASHVCALHKFTGHCN